MIGSCHSLSRRAFLATSAGCLIDIAAQGAEDLRVLDIHQHTNYGGRSDDQLVAHQRKMGVTKTVLLPSGYKITPGLVLADYPNMYGDLSAGSGLNSMLRDEDQAREFLQRHQNKLMFGSDCTDALGEGEKCLGAQILAAVRRLAPDTKIQRKIFHQ